MDRTLNRALSSRVFLLRLFQRSGHFAQPQTSRSRCRNPIYPEFHHAQGGYAIRICILGFIVVGFRAYGLGFGGFRVCLLVIGLAFGCVSDSIPSRKP